MCLNYQQNQLKIIMRYNNALAKQLLLHKKQSILNQETALGDHITPEKERFIIAQLSQDALSNSRFGSMLSNSHMLLKMMKP